MLASETVSCHLAAREDDIAFDDCRDGEHVGYGLPDVRNASSATRARVAALRVRKRRWMRGRYRLGAGSGRYAGGERGTFGWCQRLVNRHGVAPGRVLIGLKAYKSSMDRRAALSGRRLTSDQAVAKRPGLRQGPSFRSLAFPYVAR
jgi:hypothetical protein